MKTFDNNKGKPILLAMVKSIQDNKGYLSEVDGLIGDGDHGMNMNKGFTVFETRFKDQDISFSKGLDELGTILLTEIGGSMGPIYGTIFIDMADATNGIEKIGLKEFSNIFSAGLEGLKTIVDAEVGDKTLVDTLSPSVDALKEAVTENTPFSIALQNMKKAAEKGKESTKDMVAKFGRSSRLGERSRGVLDAGATSCCLIITSMADAIEPILN